MNFAYRVRDPLGKQHEGRLGAVSLDAARQQLQQDGFEVLLLEEEFGGQGLLSRRITKSDIAYTTSQLAIMVETGIPLSVALASIVEEEENAALKEVLSELKNAVEGGEDFSAALARHPKYFDRTYVSLVKASEATGMLGEMLERIATYLRGEIETRAKVRAALAYPTVMLCLAAGVTLFLLTFVLPRFEPLFARKGDALPTITKYMMAASSYLIGYWYLWLCGASAVVVGFLYARRTQPGKQTLDWLKIHAPILGPMFRKVTIGRSIRTLGTMIKSGVSVLDALELSSEVSGNYYYEKLWMGAVGQVTSGQQIHEALAKHPLLPSMLVQMMRSGEETGKLDVVLERVSRYYEREVELAIKTATGLLEPILISAMGVIIGGIGLGLLLPIFTLGRPG